MRELRGLYKGIEKIIFVSVLENQSSSDGAEEIRQGFCFLLFL